MRQGIALILLVPAYSFAGTTYVLTHRTLSPHGASTSVARYFVQDGKVRAEGLDARTAYLFADGKVYVIDASAKSIQAVTSATVAQAADRMDERVKALEDSAARLPPDRRAVLDKMAADMRAMNDSRRRPPPRQYTLTDRSELIDGRPCRIWQASEWNTKRFEFCVAPQSAIPGGADILGGMRALNGFWQGSIFAVGVNLGNAGWWTGIADLKGVPLLIREFKNGGPASETTLASIREGVRGTFDLPSGYSKTEVSFIP